MHITSTCSVTLNGWLGTGRRTLEIPAAFFMTQQTLMGQGLLIVEASRRHSDTTFGKTPLDEWSARRRDLYLTTHNTHKRQTYMPPSPLVIRTLNPSKWAVANPRLRPRGHWDRQFPQFVTPVSPFRLTVFRLSTKSVRISNTVCCRSQLKNLDALLGINRLKL
jgi:hypothetical protein